MYTFDIVSNVESHPGKTTKVLFIWHEKYMAHFSLRLDCILFEICLLAQTLPCSHALCFIMLFFYLLLLIRTQPPSTLLTTSFSLSCRMTPTNQQPFLKMGYTTQQPSTILLSYFSLIPSIIYNYSKQLYKMGSSYL